MVVLSRTRLQVMLMLFCVPFLVYKSSTVFGQGPQKSMGRNFGSSVCPWEAEPKGRCLSHYEAATPTSGLIPPHGTLYSH